MSRSMGKTENTNNESGFFKFSGEKYSLVLNLKGHSKLYWKSNEPETRLVGGIPLWINYKGENLIPSIPFSHGRYTILPTTHKIKKQFWKAFNRFYTWRHYNPSYVGFNFFYDHGSKCSFMNGYKSYSIDTEYEETSIEGTTEISSINLGVFHLLVKSFKEVFLKSKEQYICNSKTEGKKKIVFKEKSIVFEEKQSLTNVKAVSFAIRTFTDVVVKEEGDAFVFYNDSDRIVFRVNKVQGDVIQMKKKNSSTGKQKLWIIKNKKKQLESSTREIIFAED